MKQRARKMKLTLPDEELMARATWPARAAARRWPCATCSRPSGQKTVALHPGLLLGRHRRALPLFLAWTCPIFHCAFETAASTATGVKAGLEMAGDTETTVVAWAGDGGTFDIGIQALSGAAERNEDIIYVCYDNEAYMNTGHPALVGDPLRGLDDDDAGQALQEPAEEGHRAPSWPPTASPTSPRPASPIPRTSSRRCKKAKDIKGTRFFHIYAPCPTGWKSRPEDTVKLARMAVQNGIFPLFEIENGEKTTSTSSSRTRSRSTTTCGSRAASAT